MLIREPKVNMFDLIISLSSALDLISPTLVDHHDRVAYIASSIGAELDLPKERQCELVMAGALHDIGAVPLTLKYRMDIMHYETEKPHEHAELGYLFLRNFKPFSGLASIVKYHHLHWNDGEGSEFQGERVPRGSHILHLADRVAVLIDKRREVIGQARAIRKRVEEQSGKMFVPELVDAFRSLARKEYFWLDLVSPAISSILSRRVRGVSTNLSMEGLLSLAKLFCQIIDFRSRFTATHSSGVAASAEALASLVGFSERECRMMRIAGYFHDLGKLAVPTEILEKPTKLTGKEFNVVRGHTYHTYRILAFISDLEVINEWASFHHERLDGSGYPFHLKGRDLSMGARIMAVADTFTALTEDRPYRARITHGEAIKVLQRKVEDSALDAGLVSLMERHFDEINSVRRVAQERSAKEYEEVERRLTS